LVNLTLQELLESGLYFGHPSKQFDPRMKPYIFGKRQGIYIINLEKTKTCLERACEFLKEQSKEGKSILIVGTKRQARDMVKDMAKELGLLYMANRWLGGTLTNFQTLKLRIDRLNELEAKETAGLFEKLSKKEVATLRKEKERLLKNLEGIRKMERLPDVLLVVDTHKEEIAVREAKKMGLTIVGVVDTNSNPELIDYPVPANDDGIKGLRLLLREFAQAIRAGQTERAQERVEEIKRAEEKEAKEERVEEKVEVKEEVKPSVVEEVAETSPEKKVAEEEQEEPVVTAVKEEETIEKKRVVPTKPKPRPRIRAKVRRTPAKKTAHPEKTTKNRSKGG